MLETLIKSVDTHESAREGGVENAVHVTAPDQDDVLRGVSTERVTVAPRHTVHRRHNPVVYSHHHHVKTRQLNITILL